MIIRLGYVSYSKSIENIAKFHNLTYTEFSKNNDYPKLDNLIKANFATLYQILKYNQRNQIHFYRLTSNFIPLATHDKVIFDYLTKYQAYYDKAFNLIGDMRIDMHPDQFAVLNSTKKEVLANTKEILEYHYAILKAFKIAHPIIILHVGSSVFGKNHSIQRFIYNFKLLPDYLKKAIAIENDDKIYNIKDVLKLCQILNVPFVFDYHHYRCNNEGENYLDYLPRIFATWKDIRPKIHFSSPKNKIKKDFRSHNDYIEVNDFILFLESIKNLNYDIDIMLEAKAKDEALFRLVRELKLLTNYEFMDETTFIIK